MDLRRIVIVIVGVALLSGAAVTVLRKLSSGRAPEPAEPAATSDLVLHTAGATEQVLLKQTFSVQKNKIFRFEIPARTNHPLIQGTFRSFAGSNSAGAEKTKADVELMLMDEDQYQDFLKGKLEETVNTITPSSDAEVHWQLSTTLDTPQPYYFVFLNPQKMPPTVSVETDFKVSSE
jgi:hypothetical protein